MGFNVLYENLQVLLDIKNSNSQKEIVQKKFFVFQFRFILVLYDYVNNMIFENLLSFIQEKLLVDSKFFFESFRFELLVDYENMIFVLFIYEEVILGDFQFDFFNMNDFDFLVEVLFVLFRFEL